MWKEAWLNFVALVILLIGIYAALHVLVNLMLPKYPQSGVLALNTTGSTPNMQRESDCINTHLYYAEDGKSTREPTQVEKQQDQADYKRCLAGIAEVRQEVKISDMTAAALFLFLGLGFLILPKTPPYKS